MTTLLFLGAGASQPFGIPTMTEMVTKFEQYLTENEIPERFVYNKIKDELSKGYDSSRIDIESIFSVVDGISTETSPKNMGAYPYYYIKRFCTENTFTHDEVDASKKLKEILQTFIQNMCNVPSDDNEKLKIYANSYDPLFEYIHDIKKITYSNGKQSWANWKCYTTNYDLIFDDYSLDLGNVNDFFVVEQSEHPQFNSKKPLTNESFVKIHGGIDWWKLKNGKILKSRTKPFTRTEKEGIAMLYPIQQKDLYLHPWITLFQELKKGLEICRFWYFIGYAFNDPYILDIIKEAFSDDKQIIIVNPEAKELCKKFPEKMKEHIITFSGNFGDKYFAKDFQDFSKNIRTLEIKLETESRDIEIRFSMPTRQTKFIKNEGFHSGVTEISYGEGLTGYEFFSDGLNPKKTRFEVQVTLTKPHSDLEITIFTTDNRPTYVNIYNQERDVFGFTTSPLSEAVEGKYVSKNIIKNQMFTLS